ncbi:MAG TPA: AAA domain-containing protein, partial [Amycolatopsis sp.]
MAEWNDDAASALSALLNVRQEGGSAHKWVRLGIAEPDEKRGWLRVDLRGSRTTADGLTEVHLGGDQPPTEMLSYPISITRFADEILHLKEPDNCPAQARQVWNLRPSPRYLTTRLRDGLRDLERGTLADRLAAGALDREPLELVPRPPGFLDAQWEAYQACFSEGIRLVWGPPGTGKTRVLARAIEDLVTAGNRVLLVSTANIAVDNALLAVVRNMKPEAGSVVRVGTPYLDELARNDDVVLDRLTVTVTAQVDAERAVVEGRLAELTAAEPKIAELAGELDGFVLAAYEEDVRRRTNTRRSKALDEQIVTFERELAPLADRARRAEAERAGLEEEWRRTEPARALLGKVASAEARLRGIEDTATRLARAVVEAEQAATTAAGLRQRWSTGKKLRDARRREENFANRTRPDRELLTKELASLRGMIGPVTAEGLKQLWRRLESARAMNEAAGAAMRPVAGSLARARREAETTRASGLLDRQREKLLEDAERRDLPAKHARLVQLKARHSDRERERSECEARHRELLDSASRLRDDARKEILGNANVIATTLARSRASSGISKQQFDAVLVDEVGAASLGDVLLAVSWANRTAVLLGDFLQLGPVNHDDTKKVDRAARVLVDKWINSDVFSHCGIRGGADARSEAGCVALLDQFRFGPSLCEFANQVIYRDLRPGYETTGARPPDDTAMVLVDTDGLDDLAMLQRDGPSGNWWMIGALLSRALAEYHLASGDSDENGVGIVAPYRSQVDATQATLRDSGSALPAPVGTVHSTQGREFDTVVFDLVEPAPRLRATAAAWTGWMFKAKTPGSTWEYDGVRLFGVAITRARRHLYLIGSWAAVQTAAGGPLSVVNELVDGRKIRRVRAAVILGLDEAGAGRREPLRTSPVEDELKRRLRGLVRMEHIHDEISFDRVLRGQLDQARHSVWMWAPWIGVAGRDVLPMIAGLVQRGVRVTVFTRDDDAI